MAASVAFLIIQVEQKFENYVPISLEKLNEKSTDSISKVQNTAKCHNPTKFAFEPF